MEMFAMAFMQRAWLAALMMAVVCPLIGSFLVLRRQSLIGDGLGHIAFAGVAAGSLWDVSPVLSAMVACVIGAMAIEKVRGLLKESADMVLAIFFYAGMGIAVVLASMNHSGNFNFSSILFGSLVTVSTMDLWIVGGLGIAACAFVLIYYRPLQFITYDEAGAAVAGLPVATLNFLLAFLTALTVALSMRIVGLLLVSAMMVIPVAAALQKAKSFAQTIILAIGYSILSVTVGLIISYYANLAPGGTIVLVATAIFVISLCFRTKPVHIQEDRHEDCAECAHQGQVDECGHIHHEHETYQR